MHAVSMELLSRKLDQRRKDLGMSYAALARQSGVSMASVVRILSGHHPQATFASVAVIAEALGMNLDATPRVGAHQLREQRAREMAGRLVKMLQGTSGLEAQALSREDVNDMMAQTMHELLAGSPRKLWRD
jgi:transcriptional regulator with XRE-family HTH domain